MVVITKQVWETIFSAIEKPGAFKRRGDRKRLRVAVDSALELVTNQLLSPGARSREQMIRGLNQLAKKGKLPALAKATIAVLHGYDALEAISYDDDDDDDDDEFAAFLVDTLEPMMDLTTRA